MIPDNNQILRNYEEHLSLDRNRALYEPKTRRCKNPFRASPLKRNTQSERIVRLQQEPRERKEDDPVEHVRVQLEDIRIPNNVEITLWKKITRLAVQGQQAAAPIEQEDGAPQEIYERPASYEREEHEEFQINAPSSAFEAFLGSALLNACRFGDTKTADLLIPGIRFYSTLKMQDCFNRTALSYTAYSKQFETAKELILEKLITFLIEAYHKGNAADLNDIAETLVANKIDIKRTCLTLANQGVAEQDIRDIEQTLKEKFVSFIYKTNKALIDKEVQEDDVYFIMSDLKEMLKQLYDYGVGLEEISSILDMQNRSENDKMELIDFITKTYETFQ